MMDEREDVEDGTEAAAMNASSGSSSSHSHHHAHVFSERHQRGATDDQEEEGHTSVVSTSPTAMVQAALPEDVDSWVHEFMRWTSERQSQAADALIAAIQQRDGEGGLRLLYRRVHSFLHVDFLAMLPEELAINVLRFLDTRSVCTCAMVSKRWRRVVNLDRVWKPRVLQDFNPHTLEVLINRTKHILPHRLTWKQMYELRYRCETQWQSPTVATQPRHTFRGHTGVVTCLISVGDDRVLSGDTNGALHVTCLRTQRLVGQLQGHSQGVWCLDVDGTTAVSGSCDRTVRVWDLERLQCLHVLRGHTSTVRCVAITDGLVFSGARDAAVRVWDVATGNCLHTLVEHTDSVR
ncbi:hypothetical protein PTSG_08097 [Salpingoeca rosetta]|uniref:F-box domain-containing protein n=1 Tax=Salpingoeca rosetta (strain ATCC 50818 / BSB-021) TaxID=946362 RepID=F2UHZ6_SALR5|nr:uncharacterized protein PTSG_08097 [Salpingoeca rosetta]EGD76745.1 hypothetical protein PTSG_08097 [Salpingoeca rosetta]|eukprot:XP_004991117.1 hypothetical protein PTSG_08097 [Salpingoeca rosetta]